MGSKGTRLDALSMGTFLVLSSRIAHAGAPTPGSNPICQGQRSSLHGPLESYPCENPATHVRYEGRWETDYLPSGSRWETDYLCRVCAVWQAQYDRRHSIPSLCTPLGRFHGANAAGLGCVVSDFSAQKRFARSGNSPVASTRRTRWRGVVVGMAEVAHCRFGYCHYDMCACSCMGCRNQRLIEERSRSPDEAPQQLMTLRRLVIELFERFDAPLEGGPWCSEFERISMELRECVGVPVPSEVRSRVERQRDMRLEAEAKAKRRYAEALLEFERSG